MFYSTAFVLFICSSTLVFGQDDLEALQQHVMALEGKFGYVYKDFSEADQRIRDDLSNEIQAVRAKSEEQDNYLMNEIAAKTSILFDQVGNNQHQLWEKASNQEVNDIMVSLKEQDLQIQDDMSYKMDHVYKDLQEKIDDNRNEISELYSDLQNSNDALRNEMYEFVAKEVAKMG